MAGRLMTITIHRTFVLFISYIRKMGWLGASYFPLTFDNDACSLLSKADGHHPILALFHTLVPHPQKNIDLENHHSHQRLGPFSPIICLDQVEILSTYCLFLRPSCASLAWNWMCPGSPYPSHARHARHAHQLIPFCLSTPFGDVPNFQGSNQQMNMQHH